MSKKQKQVLVVLFVMIIVLFFVRMNIDQSLLEKDYDYAKAQEKIKALTTENMILEQKVLEQTSYTTVDQKAKAMGFR